MKETEFKINKKKRNIIIAIVASIIVLAGIITGVVIYNINNKPVETDEPTTETIVVDEPSEEPEETEEPSTSEEPEETEEPTEEVKPTEEPASPAHTHSYKSSVTSDATCTSNGTITYTCSCGHSYTESTPALGHNWSNADCTHCKTCSRCGTTEGSALGHDYCEHTETIHHPGEVVVGCKCSDCGIELIPDEMTAHQSETFYIDGHKCNDCNYSSPSMNLLTAHQEKYGHSGCSEVQLPTHHSGWDMVEITGPGWDEIITKWICSRCGQCK